MKIQIRDAGTTSLRAVALTFFLGCQIRFTVWGFFLLNPSSKYLFFYWYRETRNSERMGRGIQKEGKRRKKRSKKKAKETQMGVFEEEGTGHPAFRARNVLQRCV